LLGCELTSQRLRDGLRPTVGDRNSYNAIAL